MWSCLNRTTTYKGRGHLKVERQIQSILIDGYMDPFMELPRPHLPNEEDTSGLKPSDYFFKLSSQVLPGLVEVECLCANSVALDDDLQIGLSRCFGTRVEQEATN